jgi:hypothetical protein
VTVNHLVPGSSPGWAAILELPFRKILELRKQIFNASHFSSQQANKPTSHQAVEHPEAIQ